MMNNEGVIIGGNAAEDAVSSSESSEPSLVLPDGTSADSPPPPAVQDNPLARSITYTFASDKIDPMVGQRLAKMGKTARINGFRTGHVPMRVMRQRWGARCLAEVLSEQADERFSQEAQNMPERPAASPSVLPTLAAADGNYTVECKYEVLPEIAAPDLSQQTIRRPALQVGDAEIDEMIAKLQRDSGSYQPVSREARESDSLRVDFRALRDGETLEEGHDRKWILDSAMLRGEISQGLIGARAEEQRTIVVRNPDDHPDEQQRGIETTIEVKVLEVFELRLPELNDEFFTRYGISEGGLDAFRKMVGEQLKSEVEQHMHRRIHEQAMNALIAATPKFDLPRSLVQMEASAMHREMQQNFRARGLPASSARMQPQMVAEAARRVALGLIIAKWQEREKIEIAEDDISTRLNELAGGYQNPEQFIARARQDQRMMHALHLEMIERAAADWVCERAQTSDEKVSLSQLLAQGSGGAGHA